MKYLANHVKNGVLHFAFESAGNEWNGNRTGRPIGTGHRQQAFNMLVMPHRETLIAKAIELALAGNEAMLRLFIERMIPPKPVDEPITLQTPKELTLQASMEMGRDVLTLLSNGSITPKQADALYGVVKYYQENIAAVELLSNFNALHADVKKFADLNWQPSFSSAVSSKKDDE